MISFEAGLGRVMYVSGAKRIPWSHCVTLHLPRMHRGSMCVRVTCGWRLVLDDAGRLDPWHTQCVACRGNTLLILTLDALVVVMDLVFSSETDRSSVAH